MLIKLIVSKQVARGHLNDNMWEDSHTRVTHTHNCNGTEMKMIISDKSVA